MSDPAQDRAPRSPHPSKAERVIALAVALAGVVSVAKAAGASDGVAMALERHVVKALNASGWRSGEGL